MSSVLFFTLVISLVLAVVIFTSVFALALISREVSETRINRFRSLEAWQARIGEILEIRKRSELGLKEKQKIEEFENRLENTMDFRYHKMKSGIKELKRMEKEIQDELPLPE